MEQSLSKYNVLLATPFGDHKADTEFAFCFTETITLLKHWGARVDRAWYPGCADLPNARSKMFGHFLRKDYTHMLMIDSDMGWDAGDVIRLLLSGRDFIGGIGPKKTFKREFAYTNVNDAGEIIPVELEVDTGIISISEMGMAFTMISKECAKKMAEAYPDTEYDGGEKIMEFAVFDPFIIPGTKRRLPEDFAFCYRWRKIGGKVHAIPTIRLQHVGRHVWDDSLAWAESEKKA